ncbi:GlxA family transcriptional regulator [Thermoactinospora rubra]|uniref:GlxA family transcriptional regulator n=1 Tax=Thermoactinospora rubra TaxID=1088767 RepID=UPI000A118E51|nr:helix-turn-helix domain-containing protein [Thermoactinospora rubra]
MHTIAVLALDGVIPFELGIPARIFAAAGGSRYQVITCSLDGRPVRSDADFSIAVEHDASALAAADTVVLPPSEDHAGVTAPEHLPAGVREALASVRPGTRIVSICIASFVLAAAGMLDGRRATTHWLQADRFRRSFPRVRLEPEVLFVEDGDILTAAGGAAGVDACLHLIRRDHGSAVANQAARKCVVPPWRDGGQAQYIERPIPEPGTEGTAPTRAWALERLHEPLQLDDLAAHAGMSRRTFTRRFRAEVGMSPGQWLIRQRVELARHLLESSDLSVDRIAARAGFGTAASLRLHMRTMCGVSPHAYRRTFRQAA